MKQRNRKLACLCIAGALLATAGVYQSSQDTVNTTTAVAREYAVENEITGRQADFGEAKKQEMNRTKDDTYEVRAGATAAADPVILENKHKETTEIDSSKTDKKENESHNILSEETAANETKENLFAENLADTSIDNIETAATVQGTEDLNPEEQSTEEINPEEQSKEDENALEQDSQEPEVVEPEVAIAQVTNYVNVRSIPSEEGEILGKLYNDSIGTIIGEEGDWIRVSSGSVEGFVKAEFVLRGEEGHAKAEEVGTRLARVTTEALRIRQEATTESNILGLVPQEDVLNVSEEVEGWAKVSAEGEDGYVSTDYVDLYTENKVAESREEEQARLQREEEERMRAEEEARAEQQRVQAAANNQSSQAQAPAKGSSAPTPTPAPAPAPAPGTSNSSMGQNVANYALQFVGNSYVYGGTSLTNGADCSGFVMSVYKNFGISLPRTSGEQGRSGTDAGGIGNAVPGDLISYSGHIGIYIGNGQIVHASTAKTGIKVSNASYRPILSVRRLV